MNAYQFGGLYVKLNQDTLSPGDTITGSIYLDQAYASSGDKLCLSIYGKELVRWKEYEIREKERPNGTKEIAFEEVTREASYNIIHQELEVYCWRKGAVAPRGQCVFPFQFRLPSGSPGSFLLAIGNVFSEISYFVESFIKPAKGSVAKLRYKLPVVVRENPNIIAETKEVSLTKDQKTWFCINQGTVTLRTAFEKNAYVPSEKVRIITEVDNSKCAIGIKDVVFSLIQTVNLTTGQHHKSLKFKICSVSLGRIEAGQACVGQKRREASMTLPHGQDVRPLELTQGCREYQTDPTSAITPSTHGRLVQSDFTFTVDCRSEGCLCCDSAPTNSLPILVLAKAPPHLSELVLPQNWQPEQMPSTNLVLNLANPQGHETGIYVPQDNLKNQSMVASQIPYQSLNQHSPQYHQMQPLQMQPQLHPQQIHPQQVHIPNQGMITGQVLYQSINQQLPQYQQVQPQPMYPQQLHSTPQGMVSGQMPYQSLNQHSPQYQQMQPLQIQPQQVYLTNQGTAPGPVPYQDINQQLPQYQQVQPQQVNQSMGADQMSHQSMSQYPQQYQQMQPLQIQIGNNVNNPNNNYEQK